MKPKLIEKFEDKYRRRIFILPAILTLGNAICGAFAILSAISLDFEKSAYYLVFAMILDALDGRISRLTKSASEFGIQLDSLADAISFGLAPAIISWVFFDENNYLHINLQNAVAMLYMSCAIIRLARFNVETDTSEQSHLYFRGLPSPAAAFFVTFNLLLLHRLTVDNFFGLPLVIIEVYKYLLPILICISALLMVSNLRYAHIVNISLAGKKTKTQFVEIVFLFLLITVKPLISLWLICWAIVLYPLYEKYLKNEKKQNVSTDSGFVFPPANQNI